MGERGGFSSAHRPISGALLSKRNSQKSSESMSRLLLHTGLSPLQGLRTAARLTRLQMKVPRCRGPSGTACLQSSTLCAVTFIWALFAFAHVNHAEKIITCSVTIPIHYKCTTVYSDAPCRGEHVRRVPEVCSVFSEYVPCRTLGFAFSAQNQILLISVHSH